MLHSPSAGRWIYCGWLVALLLLLTPLVETGRAAAAETATKPAEIIAPQRDYSGENRPLSFKREKAAPAATAPATAPAEAPVAEGAAGTNGVSGAKEAAAGAGPLTRVANRPAAPARDSTEALKSKSATGSMGMIVFMVVVLGGLLILGLVVMKKMLPGGKALFSTPALEVLGRTHFDPQRYLALVRVGKKLLVVGVAPNGFSPVSEIADENEVADLLAVAKPKTAAGKGIFHRMFQTQLATTERNELLASTPRAGGVGDAADAEAVGEFARPAGQSVDSYDQARARMQQQVRSLREIE